MASLWLGLLVVLAGCLGTATPDADRDGLGDQAEVAAGLDPNNPDSDDDGAADGAEAEAGSNPHEADSDKDGVEDGKELEEGTSPTAADTDQDGASDGSELANQTDPQDPASTPPYQIPSVPSVSGPVLVAGLESFAATNSIRANNGPEHVAARQAIADAFAKAGLEVWRHTFTTDIAQENIVGIRWGLDRDRWIIVAGHYDTTTTLGADASLSQGIYDDGSGTWMTVHLAQAYANRTMPLTLVFVAFDGEEKGLEGSHAFVRDLLSAATPYPTATVAGMVDLDMIGLNWPGIQAPIVFVSNSRELRTAVDAAAAELAIPSDMVQHDAGIALGSSDYASFFAQGIPTGFFSSDFEHIGVPLVPEPVPAHTPGVGAYPFWHLVDTMETMTAMAGDRAHLEAGFGTAAALAARLTHWLASDLGPVEAATGAV